MELTLQNTREIALLQATTYRTFLVQHGEGNTHRYAQVAEEIGYDYNETTRQHAKAQMEKSGRDRTNHTLGSPHLHVWLGWMAELTTEKDILSTAELEIVTKHYTAIKDDQAVLGRSLTVARSTKVRDPGTRRIQYESTYKMEAIGQLLAKAILKHGGEEKVGSAPRGPRERRVRQWLSRLPAEAEEEE